MFSRCMNDLLAQRNLHFFRMNILLKDIKSVYLFVTLFFHLRKTTNECPILMSCPKRINTNTSLTKITNAPSIKGK